MCLYVLLLPLHSVEGERSKKYMCIIFSSALLARCTQRRKPTKQNMVLFLSRFIVAIWHFLFPLFLFRVSALHAT